MKRLVVIAATLVIISNTFVFARVAYNRSGEPKIITLTERELPLPPRYSRTQKDNSGLSLKIQASVADPTAEQYRWSNNQSLPVSKQKLEELGFIDTETCNSSYSNRLGGRDKSRPAWVVLAYDGSAHTNHIATLEQVLEKRREEIGLMKTKAEQAELENLAKRLDEAKHFYSRLYIVDVSLDKEHLQQLYPNNNKNLILAAEIANYNYCLKNEKELKISVSKLLPPAINAPIQFHDVLSTLPERELHMPARYQATIAMGKLNEPWLVKIEPTTNKPE